MNFFQFHIGDYAQATAHLSLIEDAIYFRLLRRYYSEESPIIDDKRQICRWVEAKTEDEKQAVDDVLNEFFDLRDGYWHNSRADEEIAEYQQRAETSRVNGGKGGRPKKNPTETQQVMPENPTETQQVMPENPAETQQQPDGKATKNHKPITNNQKTLCVFPDDIPEEPPKNKKSPSPSVDFMRFWRAWPNTARKTDRKKCWEKWRSKGFDEIAGQIVAHVELSKRKNHQWKTGYEPAPLTYLNGERWADGVTLQTLQTLERREVVL